MKFLNLFLIVFLILFASACSSGKKISTKSLPPFSISFGKSGGFTNINPEYILNSKGELYKKNAPSNEPVLLKKVDKSSLQLILKTAQEADILEVKIDYTSNITNYIEYHIGSLFNRIQWANETQLTPNLIQLNKLLLQLLKK